jgi:DNA repair protein RadC
MTYETGTIKTWAEDDRPREKLLKIGASNLSDSELIAILLRTGKKNLTAVEMARMLLKNYNHDLTELSRCTVAELSKIPGIGKVKAITLAAAIELGRRSRAAEVPKKIKITSSKIIADLMIPILADLKHEEFYIILLNRSNEIIQSISLSSGGISGTVVDQRMAFKAAIDALASAMILCHNHPSRNPMPSEEDKKLTARMKQAGELLDIRVLDHLIIAGNSYFSFADEGLL